MMCQGKWTTKAFGRNPERKFGWSLTGSQHISTAVSAVYVSHRWNAQKLQSSIAGYANDEEAAAKLYLLLRFQRGTRREAQGS